MVYNPEFFRGDLNLENFQFYVDQELRKISREISESSGSSIPPLFDIRDFWDPAGGNEIAAAGRAAIAAAVEGGIGGRIYIPAGTWTATYDADATQIADSSYSIWDVGVNEHISFEGDGHSTLIELHNGGTANIGLNLISWVGSQGGAFTVNGNATRGSYTLPLGTGGAIPVGTKLQVYGNDAAGHFHFAVVEVLSYNSGTGSTGLKMPCPITVPQANLSVRAMVWPAGGGARNLRLNGDNALQTTTNSARGIVAWDTQKQIFENLWFEGFSGNAPASGSSSGFFMIAGFANTLRQLIAERGGAAGGDDIYITWQSQLMADDLRVIAPAGFGIGFLGVSNSNIGRLSAFGRATTSTGRMTKFAGLVDCTVGSINVQGALSTGVAIAGASHNNVFGPIIARQDVTETASQNVGVWHSDENNQNNHYVSIDSSGWSENDFESYASDTGNSVGMLRCAKFHNAGHTFIANVIPAGATKTVAGLPTQSGSGKGARSMVTDATATTFASVVAGGGANFVPIYYDGTNWRIG